MKEAWQGQPGLPAPHLMVAIIRMSVVVHAAGPVIDQVRGNDKAHSRDQQPGLIMGEELLQHKKREARQENKDRNKTVVMLPVAMVKGPCPDTKGKKDHPGFEIDIMNDIDPE
jgi:hypothetical protein